MAAKRVVVVGNGRMAQSCCEILTRKPAAALALVVAERRSDAAQLRLARFCHDASVRLLQPDGSINSPGVIAAVAAERPDFVFSIDNFQIFGSALLGVARHGCINFHNGPIERYRGMHTPSWAIFNGEQEFGISWHYMERAIDAGEIAASDTFALTGSETALSLTLECIRVGVATFERHLDGILAGHRTPAPGIASARVYRSTDLPNGGLIDLRSTAAHIGRLLRATDFRPFPNTLTYARLRCRHGDLIVNEAQSLGPNTSHEAGAIVATDADLVVACSDQLLSLRAVMLRPDETAGIADAVAALRLQAGQRTYFK